MTAVAVADTAPDLPVEAGDAARPHLLRQLLRDRTAVLGMAIVVLLAVAAVLAPVLAPHPPDEGSLSRALSPPSASYPLGTDYLGRDTLSRLLFGARVSLVAAVAVALAVSAIGLAIGLIIGYVGGVLDTITGRVIDVLLAYPSFLVALVVVGALGPGLFNLGIALTAVSWAGFARIVRAATLAERQRDYVEVAKAQGATASRIIRRHVLPNIIAPVVVLTSVQMGGILLGLSGLSFLGLGVQQPTPEWGSMLSEARAYMRPAPELMLVPGAAIFLTVLGFNLLGDGLRDVLDPRLGGSDG